MARERFENRQRRRTGLNARQILRMADGKIRADSRREPPPRAEAQRLIDRALGGLKRPRKNVEQGREARHGRQAAEGDLLTDEFRSALQKEMVQEILCPGRWNQ